MEQKGKIQFAGDKVQINFNARKPIFIRRLIFNKALFRKAALLTSSG
jgi:hypothetical protein